MDGNPWNVSAALDTLPVYEDPWASVLELPEFSEEERGDHGSVSDGAGRRTWSTGGGGTVIRGFCWTFVTVGWYTEKKQKDGKTVSVLR